MDPTVLTKNLMEKQITSILKQLLMPIEKRLSSLLLSKEIFEKTVPRNWIVPLKLRIKRKGQLSWSNTSPNLSTKMKRKRNISWFNPPYTTTVTAKIGKFFLQLIKKSSLKEHKFQKTFNRNTLKLSYSCKPNIKQKQKHLIEKFYETHHKKMSNIVIVHQKTPQWTVLVCY